MLEREREEEEERGLTVQRPLVGWGDGGEGEG